MDSALCLPFGPLPSLPLHFQSNKSTTRVLITKPHFTFTPSLLSFSNGSGFSRQQRQTLAIARLSKPLKENKGGNNEIVRGTVGASLVLACAVAMMGCSSKLSPKAFAAATKIDPQQETLPTEMTESLLTAKGALKSLLDTTVQLTTAKVESQKKGSNIFDRVPQRPSKEEVDGLKMEAVRLMKAGMRKEAETQLRKAYERVKNDPEPAYNVEMALVEILIAQGKYEEASKCNCLRLEPGVQISDARLSLYKAILCTMTDNKGAKKYWKLFTDIVVQSGGFRFPF